MAKPKTKTKSKASKKDKDAALAEGAKAISAAKAAAKSQEDVKLTPADLQTDRSRDDIVNNQMELLEGYIGMRIKDNTTMAESLVLLDYVGGMVAHAAFCVGDVVNYGVTKFGHKYDLALAKTGKAKDTLKQYASVAARFPLEQRVTALPFEHHRLLLRLKDSPKYAEIVKEVGAKAAKGNAPTVAELRSTVAKLAPKKSKKVTSGKKGKGKKGKVEITYEPQGEDAALYDGWLEKLSAWADEFEKERNDVMNILRKVDPFTRGLWWDAITPFRTFVTQLAKTPIK